MSIKIEAIFNVYIPRIKQGQYKPDKGFVVSISKTDSFSRRESVSFVEIIGCAGYLGDPF